MEFVVAAALLAAVLYTAKKTTTGSPPGTDPGNSNPPLPPPPRGQPLAPGVYPAGTPGAIPIILFVQGGDNDARLYATPGSYAGPLPPKTVTVWYGPGTRVTFEAKVDPFPWLPQLTAFDHFEGPGGVSTKQNPVTQVITQTGYVRAVFAWAGVVGG